MCTDDLTTIEGHIERITFHSADSHYMVARMLMKGQARQVTIVGHLPEPKPGEALRLKGVWKEHPRYGTQFQVQMFELLLPAGVNEIRAYLSAGLIKGIGPKITERLIDHFQADTLSIIETQPGRMTEVDGIGPDTAARIHTAWQQHHAVRALMQFLQENQVQAAQAARIFKLYGQEALDILKTDPYRLAVDLPHSGFHIADAIVRRSDLAFDEMDRARACVRHLLEESFEEGHMYVARDELIERSSSAFDLDYHCVCDAIEALQAEDILQEVDEAPDRPVYLKPLLLAEKEIAQRVKARLFLGPSPTEMDDNRIMAAVVKRLAIHLSDAQLAVLKSVLSQRVVIITGGPGTGKTTLIRAISAIFEAAGRKYLLAAPTGRAARRMAEVTGRKAATLHKLMGFNLTDNQFDRNQDDPLDTEALIVDEASMVDTLLMGHVIKALPLDAGLILVGDVFQLPSVGPGTVLADLIHSGLVKTFELNDVFRQDAQSPIITRAHEVRRGELPQLPLALPGDDLAPFNFIACNDPRQVAAIIIDLCCNRLPDLLKIDPIAHVQVITPMHKGPVGTVQLNQMLQKALNSQPSDARAFGGRFHPGDKVIHLRNNYQKEVFNGEIGVVIGPEETSGNLCVNYDGRQVAYEEGDLEELSLAYAISVHKSQGSEYPVVIMPLVTQHYVMLQRNLLYTALTRAQRMVILVGNPKALRVAVEADQPRRRRSSLTWWLSRA